MSGGIALKRESNSSSSSGASSEMLSFAHVWKSVVCLDMSTKTFTATGFAHAHYELLYICTLMTDHLKQTMFS